MTRKAVPAYDSQAVDSPTLEPSHDPAQRIFELTALYEVSRILLESRPEQQVTFEVLTAAMGLAGSTWGVIWVLAGEERRLIPVAACGRPLPERCPVSIPADWSQRLAAGSEPMLWTDRSSDSPIAWLEEVEPEMLVPLSAQSSLHGLIALGPNSLDQPYGPFLMSLLGSIGHLVALALSRGDPPVAKIETVTAGTAEDLRTHFPELGRIVGESPAVLALYQDLVGVAKASCTVLLEGETGTGKQLAAEVLHALSPRSTGPFIEVDCSAFPETLIDSELFGHKKGAFTGATHDRRGVFELAHGGTLFLDELGNLPNQTQGRLLRVLQERRFRPLGGERTVDVDVRVIAATNRDLRDEVRKGMFREDLYYRVYVYPIRLAPLRERNEDIPLLARHFLGRVADENGIPVPELSGALLDRLKNQLLPGNVRELNHLMERVLLRRKGKAVLGPEDLDDIGLTRREELPAEQTSAQAGIERGAWVLKNLRTFRFNVKATAQALVRQARENPEEAPPLTDRSSLSYYLQGECFRFYLDQDGDIDRAGRELAGADEDMVPVATSKLRSSLNAALSSTEGSTSLEDTREALRDRMSKLPVDYSATLDRLAEHLWEMKRTGVSSL